MKFKKVFMLAGVLALTACSQQQPKPSELAGVAFDNIEAGLPAGVFLRKSHVLSATCESLSGARFICEGAATIELAKKDVTTPFSTVASFSVIVSNVNGSWQAENPAVKVTPNMIDAAAGAAVKAGLIADGRNPEQREALAQVVQAALDEHATLRSSSEVNFAVISDPVAAQAAMHSDQ